MKKIFLIISSVAVVQFYINAQDTINLVEPPEVYFHNSWIDTNVGLNILRTGCDCAEFGKGLMIDKGTLTVYGVAAVAVTLNDMALDITDPYWMIPSTYDTSMDNMYEYYRLYKKVDTGILDTVIMEMIAEARMDIYDSNVVGYFDRDGFYNPNYAKRYLPIRAAYFDEPIEVSETFFVVMTQYHQMDYWDEYGQYWDCRAVPIGLLEFVSSDWHTINETNIFHWVNSDTTDRENPWQICYTPNQNNQYLLLFPLLDRLPMYASPLVSGSGSTEAPVVTMESFVSVSPNPTTGMATIKSSFGIDEVELYDLGGAPVLRQRASGLTHTLDLQALPVGTYILKVRTPYGTTTKKLAVVRRD